MISPKLAALGLAAAFLALPSCAPVAQSTNNHPAAPKDAVAKGTLTNAKLNNDATAGVFAVLMAKGYDMLGNHHIHPYVLSLPKGAPGHRHWTEKWLVDVKEKSVPVTIDFKETGPDAADFAIHKN